jgi:hypothetical protein
MRILSFLNRAHGISALLTACALIWPNLARTPLAHRHEHGTNWRRGAHRQTGTDRAADLAQGGKSSSASGADVNARR